MVLWALGFLVPLSYLRHQPNTERISGAIIREYPDPRLQDILIQFTYRSKVSFANPGTAQMLFSQRKGYRPATKALQIESIDNELRSALWNCYDQFFLRKYSGPYGYSYPHDHQVRGSNTDGYFTIVWFSHFKEPINTMPDDIGKVTAIMRRIFLEGKWFDVYDFMEFTLNNIREEVKHILHTSWNNMLVRENAGYRIIDKQIVDITNKEASSTKSMGELRLGKAAEFVI